MVADPGGVGPLIAGVLKGLAGRHSILVWKGFTIIFIDIPAASSITCLLNLARLYRLRLVAHAILILVRDGIDYYQILGVSLTGAALVGAALVRASLVGTSLVGTSLVGLSIRSRIGKLLPDGGAPGWSDINKRSRFHLVATTFLRCDLGVVLLLLRMSIRIPERRRIILHVAIKIQRLRIAVIRIRNCDRLGRPIRRHEAAHAARVVTSSKIIEARLTIAFLAGEFVRVVEVVDDAAFDTPGIVIRL